MSTFEKISSLESLQQQIRESPALLVWFTAPGCNVCRDLKPRVADMIANSFPRTTMKEVNCEEAREVAAQHQIFTVPSLLIFLDGAEFIRKSRNFSVPQLAAELQRPYDLLFCE
ncbi:MAG: thioredoxin family protein [Candidatus Sedimenticola sp. (ex Thyasira tokunagai)]